MSKPTGNPNWQKGVSGNPTGRPRTKPITDEIRRLGESGAYVRIAQILVDKALDGDLKAAQEVLNRVEGKVSDRILVESSSLDLVSLLTRKAADNAKTIQPDDDTAVPDEPADVGANPVDA